LRHKLPSIQSDLAELASAIPIILNPTQKLTSKAEAIGYLYVTEEAVIAATKRAFGLFTQSIYFVRDKALA